MEPNISAWRRAVTGDLTSAFDFNAQDSQPVGLAQAAKVPLKSGCEPHASSHSRHLLLSDFPVQEAGLGRRAPLPYRLAVISAIRDTRPGTLPSTITAMPVSRFHVGSARSIRSAGSVVLHCRRRERYP